VTVRAIITGGKTIGSTTTKIDLIMIKMLINVVDISSIIKTITDHQVTIKGSMDNIIIIKANRDSNTRKDNKITTETTNKETNFTVQTHIIIPGKITDKIDSDLSVFIY
jgi:hypothetical protein